MEINGKTYRNLESQVGYLTEVAEELNDRIEEIAANVPSKVIVEELPEVGDPTVTYYVGPKGTEPNLYYEVWIWVQEELDGPFVWRELEDTDQVDLSGYLPIQDGVTTYPQVYQKNTDGTQSMRIVRETAAGGVIPLRDGDGQLYLPNQSNYAPSDHQAISKSYANDNFLAKQTGATTFDQVYIKTVGGTQSVANMANNGTAAYTVVQRDAAGRITCAAPYPSNNNEAVNVGYANDHYLAKQTGATSNAQAYVKWADGTQTMVTASSGTIGSAIVIRTAAGQINVPATPTDNTHAASKQYVDAVVGQLIYHHDMVIQYTLTGDTDYVKIAAHIDDNASTAYTDVNWHNMPLIMPDYAMYHHGSNDYLASVTKLPRGLHQDEFSEPRDGFLLTYWDGSALQNVRVNSNIFNTPTVTDVVTTW